MDHSTSLMVSLLVLLLAARVCGEFMERLGQLALVGEIAAGIILGPSVLGLIRLTPELKVISELAVFLLVFLAGLEMKASHVTDAFRGRAAWVSLAGFIVPFVGGFALGPLLHFDYARSVFLGLCIAITALPVGVRILMDLDRLNTATGQRIIAAAVFNDIAALLVLGVILDVEVKQVAGMQVLVTALIALAKTLVFLAVVAGTYRLVRHSKGRFPVSRKAVSWLKATLRGKETVFALAIVFVLMFAALAEGIGLHGVVGAFFGAMLLSRSVLGGQNFDEVQKTASGISMGFLAPIFFAGIGLEFQVKSLINGWAVGAILVMAFVSKIAGGYLGARLAGHSGPEAMVIGAGMNGRGVMELVIANIALANGFIDESLFSTLVLMGTATTTLTPYLLKKAYERAERLPETPPLTMTAA